MDATTFLATLREEILEPLEHSDVNYVASHLSELEGAIHCLEQVTGTDRFDDFWTCPRATQLAALLMGAPRYESRAKQHNPLFDTHLPSWREWLHGADLRDAVIGLLLADAHGARGRNRKQRFEQIVHSLLEESAGAASDSLSIEYNSRLEFGQSARQFDFLVSNQGKTIVAVVSIFQTRQGGRQRSILLGLPGLQESLTEQGIELLVVADGPGFSGLVGAVDQVAPKLRHFTNLHGAMNGAIDAAITAGLSQNVGQLPFDRGSRDVALTRIADLALRTGTPVAAEILGVPEREAESFLLRFEAAHPGYELDRPRPGTMQARSHQALNRANEQIQLMRAGRVSSNGNLVSELSHKLEYPLHEYLEADLFRLFGMEPLGLKLRLPSPLPILQASRPDRSSIPALFGSVDAALAGGSLSARLGVLIDPVHAELSREQAKSLASRRGSQIAVLDESDLKDILLANLTEARRIFGRVIVRDVDLSLISPFVSEGPTPRQMFFGRENEIRRVSEQIEQQSFALVGGRKAGKTSILRRLNDDLAKSRPTAYLDCQAHPDRADFLEFLQSESAPQNAGDKISIVPQAERILRSFIRVRCGDTPGVLLLDEVDELFGSDSKSSEYPHVLSRALRSISQSSTATIIATGERTLFHLTRDPSSPHWNFCTPIRIGPISVNAARELIREPMEALGVAVTSDALEKAMDLSSRHPNLLQYLGNQLIEQLSSAGRGGEQAVIDMEAVLAIGGDPSYRNRFVRTFWSQSTTLEKLISASFSFEDTVTEHQILEMIKMRGIRASFSEVSDAISVLELYSIVTQDQKGIRYASPAFDVYLRPLSLTALADQWAEELK
jgi:hypothetical protein